MKPDIFSLIDESIKLEKNVSQLYFVFSEIFPEDEMFWRILACEEEEHASMLRENERYFFECDLFSRSVINEKLHCIIQKNRDIEKSIILFQKESPTKAQACNFALHVEESLGDMHFEKALASETVSKSLTFFKDLFDSDVDHLVRVSIFMKENGVERQLQSDKFI